MKFQVIRNAEKLGTFATKAEAEAKVAAEKIIDQKWSTSAAIAKINYTIITK